MRMGKPVAVIIVFLLAITITEGICLAREKAKDQIAVSASTQAPKLTVKGTIKYAESMGGYFVMGLEPGGELFIVNQNADVLKPLYKSKKTVIVDGHITRGAEYLFIDKIDGKKYRGKKRSSPK